MKNRTIKHLQTWYFQFQRDAMNETAEIDDYDQAELDEIEACINWVRQIDETTGKN